MKNLHPTTELLYLVSCFLVLFFFDSPIFILMSIFMVILTGLRCYKEKVRESLVFSLPLFVMFLVLTPFFVERGRYVLFKIFSRRITLEGILYGIKNAVLVFLSIEVFSFIGKMSEEGRLSYIFSKRFPNVSLLFDITFSFFQTIIKNASQYYNLMSLKKKKKGFIFAISLAIPFSSKTIEDAMEMCVVLRSKDYLNDKKTHYIGYNIGKKDIAVISLSVLLTVTLFVFSFSCLKYNVFVLKSISLSIFDALCLFLSAILYALPLILGVKE